MGSFNEQPMMKLSFKHILVSLFAFLLSLEAFAQEKTLAYYNSHESEILPDAQTAFKKGEYERTLELCHWHYIIFGDDSAYGLRDKADRCQQLTKQMNDLQSAGNVKEAKEKANAILVFNPDDAAAKAMLLVEEPAPPVVETVEVQPPVEETPPVIPDTVAAEKPKMDVEEKPQEAVSVPEIVNPVPVTTKPEPAFVSKNRFVLKAGASVLDLNQLAQTIAPGGAIGLYDLGGSRIGVELGGYLCPALPSASLMGADAALVIRAAKGIYPKLGVGFFSCKSTEQSDSATQGLCAGAGLTFLLGSHFCIEVGAKYYPAVKVGGLESVTTSGVSYDFPTTTDILAGGIAPEVRIGFVF